MCLYGYQYPTFRWEGDPSLNGEMDKAIDQLYAVDLNGYWAEERKIVDSRYAQLVIPYQDFTRDDLCYYEMPTCVSDAVDCCYSWSGYQNFVRDNGREKGVKLLEGLQQRIMSTLNVDTSPKDTILTRRTSFFLLMARNRGGGK